MVATLLLLISISGECFDTKSTFKSQEQESAIFYFSSKVIGSFSSNRTEETTLGFSLNSFVTTFKSLYNFSVVAGIFQNNAKRYICNSRDLIVSLPKNSISFPFTFFT